jgi:hypothetical protein
MYGFSPTILSAKNSTRVKLNFSSISYLSKPTALVFDYLTGNQVVFDLDKDTGPLTDAQVYGTNATAAATAASAVAPPAAATAAPTVQAAPETNLAGVSAAANQSTSSGMQSLKDQINAVKERLANMAGPGSTDGSNSVGEQISQGVSDARARLERMKQGLPNGQNASQGTGSPASPAIA